MANINPGPAVTSTPSTVAVMNPANTNTNSTGTGTNDNRLLAVIRGVSLTNTGDIAAMPVINSGSYAVNAILVGNAQGGSAATGNLTLNSGAAVTGTQFRAAGVLTGVTGPTTVVAQTVVTASQSILVTSQTIYVNSTVALAGVTVDIFVYGYDLT
jgi:hypothetical protein